MIQLCESLSYGDGMSNHTLLLQRALRKAGLETVTYSDSINEGVPEGEVGLFSERVQSEEDDIVLLQFGLGGRVARQIERFSCRRILYFHNITPAHFFTGYNNRAALEIMEGYSMARRWAREGTFDAVLTCSPFNRDTLISLGFPSEIITCLPSPLMILPGSGERADPAMLDKYRDGRTNVLFVGRISPNKKQADVVRVFAYYQRHMDQKARLFLIGGGVQDSYGQAVHAYIRRIGVENVIFPGHLTDEEVLALYRCADIFLCMSEHEGFCQPIIEAMQFGVPVIAYAAAAIPDTMGDAGILLKEKDPVLAALWMERLRCDSTLREQVVMREQEHAPDFDLDRVSRLTAQAVVDFAKAPWRVNELL